MRSPLHKSSRSTGNTSPTRGEGRTSTKFVAPRHRYNERIGKPMNPKIVYFNIDGDLRYERELLAEWGLSEAIDLVEVKTPNNSPESFVRATEDADGAVVEYMEVTSDVLSKTDSLKVVSVQAIGYSNIDVTAASQHGIAVTNAPGFCSEDVALHTVGLLIDLVRKISFSDRTVRAGHWDPNLGPMPQRITGKTIGLVFFGSIPKLMLPILKALELNVTAYAPTKTSEYLAEFGVQKIDTLDELLATSDFVSMHTPLNPTTFHMIGAHELAQMKPSAFFINTARGSVVDEPALVEALRNKTIAGAGIDVIEDENNETSELFELENVVITPHSAFISEDSLKRGKEIALQQQVDLLVRKKAPTNLVNREELSRIP